MKEMDKSQLENLIRLGSGNPLEYNYNETFIDIFLCQKEKNPNAIAIVDEFGSFTYEELNRLSDILAYYLKDRGVNPNDFVVVKLPRIKEFIVSVFSIWKVGAAYVPVDPSYPEERIQYIFEDSGACFIIDKDYLSSLDFNINLSDPIPNLSQKDSVALVVYTSGSTGKPKGVLNTHAALRALCEWMPNYIGYNSKEKVAEYASFSFVQSCNDLYPPLSCGAELHIISTKMQHDLVALNLYLKENNIKFLRVTPQIGSVLIGSLDTSLEKIIMGGEIARESARVKTRVIVSYGCSETCGSVMHTDITNRPSNAKPVLGRPMPGVTIVLENENGEPVPYGEIGEICIASPQVSNGYHNLKNITKRNFVRRNWSKFPVFRSGDLARWGEDGLLEFHGRRDNMIKIRGFRVELGEIEAALSLMDGLTSFAAAARDIAGELQICVYYVSSSIDENEVRSFLRKKLPDYMMPSAIIHLQKMPQLPNGKLDRLSLPNPSISIESNIVAPSTDFEQIVFDIVARLLKTKSFGTTTNLLTIGLTSIGAISISISIRQLTGLTVSSSDIIVNPYIQDWHNLAHTGTTEILVNEPSEFYPLAENQIGIYIGWLQNQNGLKYNLPFVLKIEGGDAKRLQQAVVSAINLHPLLKMQLTETIDGLKQHRRDNVEIPVHYELLDCEPQLSFFQNLVRPFTPSNENLARFYVFQVPHAAYLFFDIHHIIFDGGSANVFLKSIASLYAGEKPATESISAYDFVLHCENLKNSKDFEESETYFRNLIADTESFVYPSIHGRSPNGILGNLTIGIPRKNIINLCRAVGITENTFFAATLTQLFKLISSGGKIQIATISGGRTTPQLENAVGMFVQTHPLVSIENDGNIVDILLQMQSQVASTLHYEHYPYTILSDKYNIKPNVIYAFQGNVLEGVLFDDGVAPIRYKLETDTAIAPLLVNITPDGDKYVLDLKYDKGLYTSEQIKVLGHTFSDYCQQIASFDIYKPFKSISLTPACKKEDILAIGRGAIIDYDRRETFIDQFIRSVRSYPDSVAVVDAESTMTYQELDTRSDILADYLVKLGVGKDVFVAIMLPRVKEFELAALSVWKAGGAYLPLGSEYPEERLRFMLEDSEAKILITESGMLQEMSGGGITASTIIRLDEFDFSRVSEPINKAEADGLAYMIYTSGSTGVPKGTMVEHRNLRAFNEWIVRLVDMKYGDAITEHASFSFDGSCLDLYPALTVGGQVHILNDEVRYDLRSLVQYFRDNSIKGCFLTARLAVELLNTFDLPLEYLMAGGEKVVPFRSSKVKVMNAYGPTECTILSTCGLIDQKFPQDNIPLGRPVPNTSAVIVDAAGNIMPRGMAGELCLCGAQVSRGYWKQPDLTAEKFCESPFFPGERMYRTGDIAYWNDKEELVCLGRSDD